MFEVSVSMPHVYWKTIVLVAAVTIMMLLRAGQLLLMTFITQIPSSGNIVNIIVSIPGFLLDILICITWVAILINEKIGEKWGAVGYILLLLAAVAITFVRLSVHI